MEPFRDSCLPKMLWSQKGEDLTSFRSWLDRDTAAKGGCEP